MARVLGRHCFLYCVFLLFSLLIYRTCNVLPSSTFHGSVNRQSPKASTYPNVDQILQKQKSEQDEAPARISGASVKANNIFGVPPVKRTISDKDWEDAVRNGARLVDLTKARTKEAAQVLLDEMKRDPPLKIESQFMSYDDLVANGWAYYPLEETGYEEYVDEGLKPVLEAIGATKENLGDSVIWIQPGKTPRWPVSSPAQMISWASSCLLQNSTPAQMLFTRTISMW